MDLADYFKVIDSDANGSIDSREFRQMLELLGVRRTEAVVAAAFAEIDSDGNGRIDLIEFRHWWERAGNQMAGPQTDRANLQALRDAFDQFDQDGSGRISMEEFRQLLAAIGPSPTEEEFELAFSVADRENTGDVTFEDFISWWLDQ